jgi:pseudouridine kinase
MDMSMALVLPERKSSTYLYVNDAGGDMQIAISDMEISKCLGREHLEPLMAIINEAEAVVVDANLEEDTIRYICENCTAPIYADPVSTVKAVKLRSVLDKLYCLKPNAIEAEKLTGEKDPAKAAEALVKMGVKRVFVSCGGDGMVIADDSGVLSLPALKIEVINTTGAGDAAAAAIIMAGVSGKGLEESAHLAMQAGAMTCRCLEANNPEISQLFK